MAEDRPSNLLVLMNQAAHAREHIMEAQECARRAGLPSAPDAEVQPWPTVLSKLSSAATFVGALQQALDSSITEAATALCPRQLCSAPEIRYVWRVTELLRTRLEPEQEKEAAQMMSSDYPAYFRQEPDVLEAHVTVFNKMCDDIDSLCLLALPPLKPR